MSVEKMTCCGHLTRVYQDAGNRQHNPGCASLDAREEQAVAHMTMDQRFLSIYRAAQHAARAADA